MQFFMYGAILKIHTLLEKYPNNYLQQSTLITGEQDEIMA